jgi:hypothetical protein
MVNSEFARCTGCEADGSGHARRPCLSLLLAGGATAGFTIDHGHQTGGKEWP